jgi:hypothetical protein
MEETKPTIPRKLSSSFYYPPFGVKGEKEKAPKIAKISLAGALILETSVISHLIRFEIDRAKEMATFSPSSVLSWIITLTKNPF